MGLLSNSLWGFGLLCLVALLYRAQRLSILGRYPYFYAYVALVLCAQIVKVDLALGDRGSQSVWATWVLELFTALAGFGVTWEIYKQSLLPYPGARRMARFLLSGVFTAVLLEAAIQLPNDLARNVRPKIAELEQSLRVSQALLLMVLLALIVYYAIPLGRNVWSMLAGYGLLIASNAIILTTYFSFPHVEWKWLSLFIQVEYCGTLAVWYIGMRSYSPNPISDIALERDYERIYAYTARSLNRLRAHLTKGWWE